MECIFLLVFNSDTKFQMHPYPVKSLPGNWKRKKKKIGKKRIIIQIRLLANFLLSVESFIMD